MRAKPLILVVDDEHELLEIMSMKLVASGFDTVVAYNGREAIDASKKIHPDLILMDIIMPHLDGVSATVCIREIRPTIPVIAMTSNIRADDIDMYFRYG